MGERDKDSHKDKENLERTNKEARTNLNEI
jgi:hypothetical protein